VPSTTTTAARAQIFMLVAPLSFLLALGGCGGGKRVTLRTHCGVLSASVDGKLWLAAPPLSDGSGNPPPGWGENQTKGTWRQEDGKRATFRSDGGKVAHFVRARPGAKDPAAGCE
jgi:hypothetical protein